MDPISLALMSKALDCLNQRYLYTAENIANANSRNYRPVRVAFEDALRDAAAEGPDAIRTVEPSIAAEQGAEPMRLDLELASASQTAMRYRALAEVLSGQLALERTAISGGR